MAVKNYGIHDQWTNLDKLNNVDIKSVDGVVESVKINGEEAGGGGSSDLSTAEVTINDTDGQGWSIEGAFILDRGSDSTIYPLIYSDEQESIQIALYKGKSVLAFPGNSSSEITVSGDAVNDGIYITVMGDCAITLPSIG